MAPSDYKPQARLAELIRRIPADPLLAVLFEDRSRVVAIFDPEGRIAHANATPTVLTGISTEDLIGAPITALPGTQVRPGAAADWVARFAQLRDGAPGMSFEAEFVPVDGERLPFRVVLNPLRESGELIGSVMVADDIRTERVAFERMRESQERFQALVESLPQMVWSSQDGEADYFAPSWATFTGRSVERLTGRGWLDLVHPDDRDGLLEGWRIDRLSPAPRPRLFRMRRADGEYRWMEAQLKPIRDADGTILKVIGTTLDVTDRHRAGERVRQQREQLRALLQISRMGSYTWSPREGKFEADARFYEIVGVEPDASGTDWSMTNFLQRVHPEDRDRVAARMADARGSVSGRFDREYRILVPAPGGGEPLVRWIAAMGRVEFDEHGPTRMIGVVSDINERKEAEESRLRLQRVEAMGALAGGIAHDLGNIAGAILSYARVAEAELAAGASPAESIEEIARGALHAGEIVQRLLTFGRSDGVRHDRFDAGEVARQAESLLRPTMPPQVTLELRVAEDLPPVIGDPTQLHQALVNLIANAAQAIATEVGLVLITVDAVPPGALAEHPNERCIRIRVDDDGPGIAASAMPRLWDPFFTTKPEGEGTGLGLPVVQNIVQNHGGTVTASNRSGGGARFEVLLPAAREPQAAAAVDEAESINGRVLFVDDEEALVRAASRAMPYRGFQVTGHTDPLEALAAFEADPNGFDVLITDLSMPGLTGLQLMGKVRALRPDIVVVLTSGFIGDDVIAGQGVDVVMPKPCSVDDLAAAALRLLRH